MAFSIGLNIVPVFLGRSSLAFIFSMPFAIFRGSLTLLSFTDIFFFVQSALPLSVIAYWAKLLKFDSLLLPWRFDDTPNEPTGWDDGNGT